MSEAPREIWAFLDGAFVGMFVSGGITDGGTHYIRADIAQAELDAAVRAAYREGWRFAWDQCNRTGSVPDPDYAANMEWVCVKPGRWRRADGAEIIEELGLPPTLEEALEQVATYALKLPGQLWRDVQSFPTLADAQRAAAIRARGK